MKFDLFVGIDYSGAETPESRLKPLQVYAAEPAIEPKTVPPPDPNGHGYKNWSRHDIAHWLRDQIMSDKRLFIGIDHGFSFPVAYFERYRLKSWPTFLTDFCHYWPTHEPHCYIDFILDGNWWTRHQKPRGERTGTADELRLCEQWTSSASSVFRMHGQGCVGKSTHAGLPWLKFLRDECRDRLHFWPHDGWIPEEGASVIAEAYPSIFKRRYPKDRRTADQQDAYSIARWLEETVRRDILDHYLQPPLTLPERQIAALEGWILGIT